jgi:hypothetical protein
VAAIWKWVAATSVGLVLLLSGAFLGDFAASVRYAGLHGRMSEHERLSGHPVMEQKFQDLKEANQEALNRIEAKLERQSVVLREIERGIKANGDH